MRVEHGRARDSYGLPRLLKFRPVLIHLVPDGFTIEVQHLDLSIINVAVLVLERVAMTSRVINYLLGIIVDRIVKMTCYRVV